MSYSLVPAPAGVTVHVYTAMVTCRESKARVSETVPCDVMLLLPTSRSRASWNVPGGPANTQH